MEQIVKSTLFPGQPIPEETLKRLEEADKLPVTFDEDCPELTDEQMKEFAIVARQQRKIRRAWQGKPA